MSLDPELHKIINGFIQSKALYTVVKYDVHKCF